MAGVAVIGGLAFIAYEELRRARSNDFPFRWEPLFVHGILLIVIGAAVAVMLRLAVTSGVAGRIVAAFLIGSPSLVLALAPYLVGALEVGFVPGRLVGDGFHQLGMAGMGVALAVLFLPAPRLRPPAVEATQPDE